MTRQQVLDLYFMDARFRLVELAAFLDRVDRAAGGLEPHVQVADLKQRRRRSWLRGLNQLSHLGIRGILRVFLCP